jgi:ankyrin repeat protein
VSNYRLCVAAGGNVNAKDRKGGQTPLYLAAAEKQWECVKYLLEKGADPSIPCQVCERESMVCVDDSVILRI